VRAGAGAGREDEAQKANPRRVSGFLRALDGDEHPEADKGAGNAPAPPESGKDAAPQAAADAGGGKPSRKARLLERITGLDKNSA
jgi:hypothetical protein